MWHQPNHLSCEEQLTWGIWYPMSEVSLVVAWKTPRGAMFARRWISWIVAMTKGIWWRSSYNTSGFSPRTESISCWHSTGEKGMCGEFHLPLSFDFYCNTDVIYFFYFKYEHSLRMYCFFIEKKNSYESYYHLTDSTHLCTFNRFVFVNMYFFWLDI